MRTRVAPLLLSALLAAFLIIVANDVFRQVIIDPVLHVAWYVAVLVDATPQGVFWAILIVITLYVIRRSLAQKKTKHQQANAWSASNRGPVAAWTALLDRAEKQEMSKWRLAKGLKTLTGDIVPRKDSDSIGRNRRRNRLQHADLPSDIEGYFEASLPSYQRFPRLSRLLRADGGPKDLNLDPAIVIAYLEEKTDPLTGE